MIPSFWNNTQNPNFDPFQSLRRDVQDMFGMIERRLPESEPNGHFMTMPSLDLAETKESIEVTAELPGVSEKDISVSLEKNRLIISGEKKKETEDKGKDYYLSERSFGAFSRAIPLAFEPTSDAIDARCDQGILRITIKKPADIRAKAYEIPVKVDGSSKSP
jgi:HSP20 family protein